MQGRVAAWPPLMVAVESEHLAIPPDRHDGPDYQEFRHDPARSYLASLSPSMISASSTRFIPSALPLFT